VNPGGMIMIHGQRNSLGDRRVQPSNWTNGCIAVLNHEMDEIWNAIEPGTPSSSSPDPVCQRPLSCGRCICRRP
jgi:murein L,D-transpeptidase YafK